MVAFSLDTALPRILKKWQTLYSIVCDRNNQRGTDASIGWCRSRKRANVDEVRQEQGLEFPMADANTNEMSAIKDDNRCIDLDGPNPSLRSGIRLDVMNHSYIVG